MKIGKTLYLKNWKQWRSWLEKNHKTASEIWLIYYKKHSNKPRIPYNDAVEEALCFGWIDSTTKPINGDCYAQRFSPRRKNSILSEMNKERVKRLVKAGKMTKYGLESIKHHLNGNLKLSTAAKELTKFKFPEDILAELKKDSIVWKNFNKFSEAYKRIRIGWIHGARIRPDEFNKRLRYFLKMTAKNKKFGMVQ